MHARFIKLASFIFFISIWSPSQATFAEQNKALIIGISQYQQISSLKFADADALEFSQLLTEFSNFKKNDVVTVLNQQATKKRITEEINKLVIESNKKPFNNFIFMFAGHGVESRIKTQDKNKKIEEKETNIFLAPTDASLNENNFYTSADGREISNETFINKAWLAKQLSSIKSNRISIVIDSCYSGNKSFFSLLEREAGTKKIPTVISSRDISITQNQLGDLPFSNINTEPLKIAYLASSRDDQASAEYDELRHGALSYAIFEYIRGVRKTVSDTKLFEVTIDNLYTNIIHLFEHTKVEGKSLNAEHQPILFALPDLPAVQRMGFLSLQGVLRDTIAQKALLKISTEPSGVEVFIDGTKRAEKTDASFELLPGKYLIELYLPSTGYRFSFTKDLKAKDHIEEKFSFLGKLEVASLIEEKGKKLPGPDLDIFLNGAYVDKSKLFNTNLLAGTHLLEVRFQNVSKTKQVEIRPDSPLRVNYTVTRDASLNRDDRGVRNVVF